MYYNEINYLGVLEVYFVERSYYNYCVPILEGALWRFHCIRRLATNIVKKSH